MNYLMLFCSFFAAADSDTSCVLLLNGDGDPPWGSAVSAVPSMQNHGATTAAGKFGGAVRFDGESAYLDGGQLFGRGFCFPQQTISVWIRPERDGKLEGIVGSQEKPGQASWRWSLVRHPDGTVAFQFYDNAQTESPRREVRGTTIAKIDVWTHVTVVIDIRGGAASLHMNGRQEGSVPIRSNYPFGSLIVGHSLGGPFLGSVDELAIFERAFSPEDVVALAARSDPLPDIAPQQWSGFWIRPQSDTAYLGFRHSDLPDSQWLLRVTEYAYYDPEQQRNMPARDVKWTVGADRKSAQFRWDAPEDLKQKVGLDFWGGYTANGDQLDFTITGKNVGTVAWDHARLSLVCLISGGAPAFVDYDAQRTFVHRGQNFVTMNEIVEGQFAPHRMCGVSVSHGGDEPISRLAAKVSTDGKWVLGLAVDCAESLSFNFQERTSCIHSNPAWPRLERGEQATARGRAYLFQGTLDELWERYTKDFESE